MKGKDMYSQTIAVLEKYDNDREFERMCGRIVVAQGYKDVVLVAPRGGSDGGLDITFTTESGGKGLACVTLRKDIERKFEEDFSKRSPGEFEKYILFCTAYLTAAQKLKFTRFCLEQLEALFIPYDIEGLGILLDSTFMLPIRSEFLYISDHERQQINQERQRRSVILTKLRNLWILSHDGISPGMMAGTEPLSKEWVEGQLEAMGETWLQDTYY
jgi:hypothetical protein